MSIFGISEHRLGPGLWAMKEKVSDPCPPSPICWQPMLGTRTAETEEQSDATWFAMEFIINIDISTESRSDTLTTRMREPGTGARLLVHTYLS